MSANFRLNLLLVAVGVSVATLAMAFVGVHQEASRRPVPIQRTALRTPLASPIQVPSITRTLVFMEAAVWAFGSDFGHLLDVGLVTEGRGKWQSEPAPFRGHLLSAVIYFPKMTAMTE